VGEAARGELIEGLARFREGSLAELGDVAVAADKQGMLRLYSIEELEEAGAGLGEISPFFIDLLFGQELYAAADEVHLGIALA
jgi:hypothetical protein